MKTLTVSLWLLVLMLIAFCPAHTYGGMHKAPAAAMPTQVAAAQETWISALVTYVDATGGAKTTAKKALDDAKAALDKAKADAKTKAAAERAAKKAPK